MVEYGFNSSLKALDIGYIDLYVSPTILPFSILELTLVG
jgi:hypothetical protein